MAEVLVLPGVERRDLCGEAVPAAEVLARAIENGVTDVIIVGRDRAGAPYIAGSLNDMDKVVGLLFSAATYLANSDFAHGIPETATPQEPA